MIGKWEKLVIWHSVGKPLASTASLLAYSTIPFEYAYGMLRAKERREKDVRWMMVENQFPKC